MRDSALDVLQVIKQKLAGVVGNFVSIATDGTIADSGKNAASYEVANPNIQAHIAAAAPHSGHMLTHDVRVRAYMMGNQSVPAATWVRVEMNAEIYDVGADYDAVTTFRFTSPETADYLISPHCTVAPQDGIWATDSSVQLAIHINGSMSSCTIEKPRNAAGFANHCISFTDIPNLALGSYAEIWIQGSEALFVLGGSGLSFLCIRKAP